MNSKALFGGALLAAGMTANAQEFIFNVADVTGGYSSYSYITDNDGYGSYVISYAPDDLNLSFSGLNGDGAVIRNSNLLRAEATQTAPDGYRAYIGANIQQFFQVSQDADLVISWNLSNTDGFNQALLFNDDTGDVLFDLAVDGPDETDGSATIALQAGVNYAGIFGTLQPGLFGTIASFTFEGTAFVQAELIPAPATAGLMGLAGLVATRRRR